MHQWETAGVNEAVSAIHSTTTDINNSGWELITHSSIVLHGLVELWSPFVVIRWGSLPAPSTKGMEEWIAEGWKNE